VSKRALSTISQFVFSPSCTVRVPSCLYLPELFSFQRSIRLQHLHEDGARAAQEVKPQARPQGPFPRRRRQLDQGKEVDDEASLIHL